MKRNAGILGLLFCLFAAPGLIAYAVYVHPEWVQARTNHGRLLQPPPLLREALPTEKWQLVYWTPDTCAQACRQRLDELAKLRLALGRRLYYVDLVVASPIAFKDALPALQEKLTDEDGHWLQIQDEQIAMLGKQPAIYLVNPQHYVILAYSVTCPLNDIFKDLQKMVHDK